MNRLFSLILIFGFAVSCTNRSNNKTNNNTSDTASLNSKLVSDSLTKDSSRKDTIQPIFGYRFIITGNFASKNSSDTLVEHFYSKREHKEVNKYYSGIDDMWVLYDSSEKRNCFTYIESSNQAISKLDCNAVLGLLWLKNEGDLDGDGLDECSYVSSLAQESSINHCHIISYKHNQWKELYSFEIREWQLPLLPEGGKTYGLFGADGMYVNRVNDSLNKKLQQQLDSFPGFIKKLNDGRIKINTFTRFADDTALIIDLSKQVKRYN